MDCIVHGVGKCQQLSLSFFILISTFLYFMLVVNRILSHIMIERVWEEKERLSFAWIPPWIGR